MQPNNINIYDTIIVGAGPAGLTSALYLLRANKKVLLIEKESIGGGISSAPLIENYPGFVKISGMELADNLFEQINNFNGELEIGEVKQIEKIDNNLFKVNTNGQFFYSKSIIISSGTKYQNLGLKNEKDLIGHGISFCVTCDGAFFKNQVVAVVGGGNIGVTNAIELADICKEVIVIIKNSEFNAEQILINRLKSKNNIRIIPNAEVSELIGNTKLEAIKVKVNNTEELIKINGMFVSIGRIPETDFIKNLVNLNEKNYIDSKENCKTNISGIFVAGDVRNKQYRQITTSVADGTVAALEAIKYLENF